MKKIAKWSGIIILVAISALYITIESLQDRQFNAPMVNIIASTDSTVIARGKSLVFGAAHCANCHAPASMEALVEKGIELPLSGGQIFDLPLGKIYTPNLTPHASGIAGKTDAALARTLRYGVRYDNTAVFDIMPFHNTSDEDLTAIISYLRQQQPVENRVPSNKMNLIGKAAKAFLIKPVGPLTNYIPAVRIDSTVEYGNYLATSIANCKGCHTNRNLMTGAFIGADFAGGLKFEMDTDSGKYSLTTPNLTPHQTGRINGWSKEQFISRFRAGKRIAQTHMPWGPFSRMSELELTAIYKFLQTVKPVDNLVPTGMVKAK